MSPLIPILLLCCAADPIDASERELLKQFNIEPNESSLITFIHQQTLNDARKAEAEQLLRDLGSNRFTLRDRASKRLPEFGVAIRPMVQSALSTTDPEIRQRLEKILNAIDSPQQTVVLTLVARRMSDFPSAATVDALVDFLPFSPYRDVTDEILSTLIVCAEKGHTSRLRAAITAQEMSQRMAAGFVLGRLPTPESRKLVQPLLDDREPSVRLGAAQGLLMGKDRAAIPTLIALLESPIIEVRTLADELLRRTDDENDLPTTMDTDDEAGRKTYRQKWEAWWQRKGERLDLSRIRAEPVPIGLTVGIEYNTGRVWEVGLDGKIRWEIIAKGPMDAHVLPNQRVLIAESEAKKVTERDFKGNIIWQHECTDEPLNCRRLANGITFIGTRHDVIEVDLAGKERLRHHVSDTYLHAIRRLPNGHFLGITSDGQIREIDRAGKLVRSIQLADEGRWGDVDAVEPGRYIVANYGTGFLREVNLEGKTIWELKVSGACGVNVTPGKRFLVAAPSKAILIDQRGNLLWESAESNGSVRRAHRR